MDSPTIVPYGHSDFLRAYGAVWSSGDGELLGRYFAEDGVYIDSSYQDRYGGRAEVARFSRFMHAFSSEVKIEYLSHCGNGDLFALEWLWSGVATGPIRIAGVVYPPANKAYAVPGAAICRANASGEMVYHRDYWDLQTLMRQLGIGASTSS